MTATDDHSAAEARALALWEAGALDEAAAQYAAAIASCPASHWARGQYHSGLAGVLAALGRHEDARGELELALAHAIEVHGEGSPSVAVARYFLGNHCVTHGSFAAALMTVMPAIAGGTTVPALLRMIQARALAGLGRDADARVAARAAVDAASEEQREKIRAGLAGLLGDAEG